MHGRYIPPRNLPQFESRTTPGHRHLQQTFADTALQATAVSWFLLAHIARHVLGSNRSQKENKI